VLLGVLAVTQLGGDGDSEPANRTGSPNQVESAPSAPATGAGAPVARDQITVSVLNGTTVPGLAAEIADQLEQGGFKRGTVTNAADQQRPATTIAYAAGNRRGADEAASLLKVRRVEPLDPNTQAIAGADALVVVTVGTDRTR